LQGKIGLEKELTVREAGRRGGLAVLKNRGRQYFIEIGMKGQTVMRQKYPNMASEWGKRGGRPKKLKLCQIMGERGKQ
jgi:general stress protein YciG